MSKATVYALPVTTSDLQAAGVIGSTSETRNEERLQ